MYEDSSEEYNKESDERLRDQLAERLDAGYEAAELAESLGEEYRARTYWRFWNGLLREYNSVVDRILRRL